MRLFHAMSLFFQKSGEKKKLNIVAVKFQNGNKYVQACVI